MIYRGESIASKTSIAYEAKKVLMSFRSVDRLSSLPRDIISHILSLMPTKCAVRTSILSKSWRYSWTLIWNLDFENIDPNFIYNEYAEELQVPDGFSDSFLKFVDRVLECCNSTQIKVFRLHVLTHSVPKSSLLNWTDKAIGLNACEIDIRAYKFELPLSLLSCKTLTKLRLYHDFSFPFHEGPCLVNLPCLKTLDIHAYRGPFVNVLTLISGCPILECLSFQVWHRIEVEDYIFNTPTLKRLELTVLECESANKVVLHAPKLEYLFVGGYLCSSFVMENVSCLVEASVLVSFWQMDHMWVELLEGISGVRSLSFGSTSFCFCFCYSRDQISSPLPIFPNLKCLDLKGCWYPRLPLQFLEGFPELKHLQVELKQKFLESPWIKQKPLVPACMLTSLTTINISKFSGRRDDVLFLRYMLGKAKVLKAVTITCDAVCIQRSGLRMCLIFPGLPCSVRFVFFEMFSIYLSKRAMFSARTDYPVFYFETIKYKLLLLKYSFLNQ